MTDDICNSNLGRKEGRKGGKEGKIWRGMGAETNIKTNKTKTN